MTRSRDVSIVLCTRERAELLVGALRAIRTSLPAGVEVLVVDSASTTAATLNAAREASFPVVRTDVKGLSIARNLGLRSTDRAIVVFTDDDCEPVEGWIEALAAAFGDDDRVGAVTGRLLDHSAPPPAAMPKRRLTRTLEGLDAGHGAVMAFRRELVLELGGFDEVLGAGRRAAGAEDLDMFCRVLESGHTVVVEPAAIVRHVFTRDDDAYVELNTGYGRGLGAMAAKWLRRRPAIGIPLSVRMIARAGRRALRVGQNPRARSGARALLDGIRVGFAEQLRTPLRGGAFVDVTPPEPIRFIADGSELR